MHRYYIIIIKHSYMYYMQHITTSKKLSFCIFYVFFLLKSFNPKLCIQKCAPNRKIYIISWCTYTIIHTVTLQLDGVGIYNIYVYILKERKKGGFCTQNYNLAVSLRMCLLNDFGIKNRISCLKHVLYIYI